MAEVRCNPGGDLDHTGPGYRVSFDRIRGHRAFGQGRCSGLVTESHVGQCEISHDAVVFRLFFEKGFQFSTGF